MANTDIDIREEMLKVVENKKNNISGYSLHTYKNINEKKKKNLLYIDKYFDYNNFIAIIDTTTLGNARKGIVFMTNGIYLVDMLSPKYFINYLDIVKMYRESTFPKDIIIQTTTYSDNIEYSTVWLHKDTGYKVLFELIEELKILSFQYDCGYRDLATGKVSKNLRLTSTEKFQANAIIHLASGSAAAVGAGLSQIPLSDAAVIVPIQITMILSLGNALNVGVTKAAAQSIISSLGAAYGGRALTQVLVGWIPGLGNAINASTAALITEAIGWIAVRRFKEVQNGSYMDGLKVGATQASREYDEKFRKQAQEFIKQKNIYKEQLDEWAELIAAYDASIADYQLKDKENQTIINELKAELEQLKSMKVSKN